MTYLDDLQMIKASFMEMGKQAKGLAVGLQNAAPPTEAPSPSVCYLLEATEMLQDELKQVNRLIQEMSS